MVLLEEKWICHIVLRAFAASSTPYCDDPRRMISIRCALLCPHKDQLESLSILERGAEVQDALEVNCGIFRAKDGSNHQDHGPDGHGSRDQR